jgi:hypothetical protein
MTVLTSCGACGQLQLLHARCTYVRAVSLLKPCWILLVTTQVVLVVAFTHSNITLALEGVRHGELYGQARRAAALFTLATVGMAWPLVLVWRSKGLKVSAH